MAWKWVFKLQNHLATGASLLQDGNVQAFMVLYPNPGLLGSCNQKPGKSTPNILDDALFNFLQFSGWKQVSPASPEPSFLVPSDQSQTHLSMSHIPFVIPGERREPQGNW